MSEANTPVAPLYALHRIHYGEQKAAQPGDIFRPVSKEERDEIVQLEAGRDLTEAEQALFDKLEGAKAKAAPTPAANVKSDAGKSGDSKSGATDSTGGKAPADQDPLG